MDNYWDLGCRGECVGDDGIAVVVVRHTLATKDDEMAGRTGGPTVERADGRVSGLTVERADGLQSGLFGHEEVPLWGMFMEGRPAFGGTP